MKHFLLLSTLLFAPHVVTAQVIPPQTQQGTFRQHIFGLGLFAGASAGLGLSFRHHLPMPLSYQVTGGIIKTDGKLRSDIGFNLQYDLARTDRNRFYVAGSFGYYYSGRDGNNEMSAPNRGGLGIGSEWVMNGGMHLLLEAVFTFFSDGNVLPLPQAGFYYYFN
jgi:hypothetical protein